mmetsp:Transcript_4985/g.8903  ORF Transcript_4985/g.8903 Transcript_4985/m.8903 type:complete len:300 (-) Transcript_4985:367-1266(-)
MAIAGVTLGCTTLEEVLAWISNTSQAMFSMQPLLYPHVTMLPSAEMLLELAKPDPCAPHPYQAFQEVSREAMSFQPVHFGLGGGTPRLRVLCLGDSLTAGFQHGGQMFEPYGREMHKRLAALGFHCEVAVCGYNGRTTHDMVLAMDNALVDVCGCCGEGLLRILGKGRYDLVFIMSGTNDMANGTCTDQILHDLSALHFACHRLGIPTVALVPPPSPKYSMEQVFKRSQLALCLAGLATRTPGICAYIDPAEAVTTQQAACWDSDALHFSSFGSKLLGSYLAERLHTVLPPGTDLGSCA